MAVLLGRRVEGVGRGDEQFGGTVAHFERSDADRLAVARRHPTQPRRPERRPRPRLRCALPGQGHHRSPTPTTRRFARYCQLHSTNKHSSNVNQFT